MPLIDLLAATLFVFAAAVQFNDPDPVRWVAIYAAASALSIAPAYGRRVPPVLFATVGVIALLWAVVIMVGGPGTSEYGRMFDAWEMKSLAVEEAREASGLLVVAAWMGVLLVRARRRAAAAVRG